MQYLNLGWEPPFREGDAIIADNVHRLPGHEGAPTFREIFGDKVFFCPFTPVPHLQGSCAEGLEVKWMWPEGEHVLDRTFPHNFQRATSEDIRNEIEKIDARVTLLTEKKARLQALLAGA